MLYSRFDHMLLSPWRHFLKFYHIKNYVRKSSWYKIMCQKSKPFRSSQPLLHKGSLWEMYNFQRKRLDFFEIFFIVLLNFIITYYIVSVNGSVVIGHAFQLGAISYILIIKFIEILLLIPTSKLLSNSIESRYNEFFQKQKQ